MGLADKLRQASTSAPPTAPSSAPPLIDVPSCTPQPSYTGYATAPNPPVASTTPAPSSNPFNTPAYPPPTTPTTAAPSSNPFDTPAYPPPATGQYPPPATSQYPPPATGQYPLQEKIFDILSKTVKANRIGNFYDTYRLQILANKLASVDYEAIAKTWNIPTEIAYDLTPIALYDTVFYCDDSSSMRWEENGTRIDDLKFILSTVADIIGKFDHDGMSVRFMNGAIAKDGIRDSAEIDGLMANVEYTGITPLGTEFNNKIIDPFVFNRRLQKPVHAVVITDGSPTGEHSDTFARVVKAVKKKVGESALAIQIAQVGKDAAATNYLQSLDVDKEVGNMIDVTSHYEIEEMQWKARGIPYTPYLWILKLCTGAINPEYGARDD